MDYTIVQANNIFELMSSVKENIGMGWIPLGGVSATIKPSSDWTFHQAMIKPDKKEHPKVEKPKATAKRG